MAPTNRGGDRTGQERLGRLQLLAGALVISFSSILVRLAQVGPSTAGFYRVLLGGLALLALVVIRGERLWAGWLPLAGAAAAGIFFGLDLIFWHRAIHYAGPGLATILSNLQVFFVAGFAFLFLGERMTLRFVLAVSFSILGLIMIVGPDWSVLGPRFRLGVWLGLLTAAVYAGYILCLHWSGVRERRLSSLANMALLSLVTVVILFFEIGRAGESLAVPNAASWAALLGYGLGCHGLGWLLISSGLAKVPVSRAGLILLLQPALAFVWDILIFHRPTGPVAAAGAVLTLGAIYLGSRRSG